MPAGGLVDTGALLALIDRDDRWHRPCRVAFETLRLPLLTTAAVLAELFHLVGDHPREVDAAWGLVRSGAIEVVPITDPDLAPLHRLMERYRDRPMDFADATLVHLADREKLSTVFTIDHSDFESYRFAVRRRFQVVPPRQPAGR